MVGKRTEHAPKSTCVTCTYEYCFMINGQQYIFIQPQCLKSQLKFQSSDVTIAFDSPHRTTGPRRLWPRRQADSLGRLGCVFAIFESPRHKYDDARKKYTMLVFVYIYIYIILYILYILYILCIYVDLLFYFI